MEAADNTAAAHDERPIGDRFQVGGPVGNIEDRKALRLEAEQDVEQAAALVCRKACGRFVENQQLGPVGKRPGDGDELPVGSGQIAEIRVKRQRKAGSYRDLIALIEFGDEAYVVTPFTTDYDSVLLSASLIGDWGEFMQFPNQGTSIGVAIARAA